MQDSLKNIINNNINNYKIEKFLSCGTIGCIFLASNNLNELFALKFVKVTNFNSFESICLKILKNICYQDILCYIEDFNIKINNIEYQVIVTEFLQGYITLFEYIQNYNYNKFTSNKIIHQMKSSMNKIHKTGILHGDINSKNILINPNTLDIKLIDFGNCKLLPNKFNKDDIYFDSTKLNFIIDYIRNNSN
jgi:serine/threonine protein kinase